MVKSVAWKFVDELGRPTPPGGERRSDSGRHYRVELLHSAVGQPHCGREVVRRDVFKM